MKITMYELMGCIKDNKAPRVIKYEDIEFIWTDGNYIGGGTYLTNYVCDLDDREIANLEFEILPEENSEWEDIYTLTDNEEHHFMNRQNGMTQEDRRLLDSNFKTLSETINQLIKNQKYLKAMVQSLQRPFTDEIRVDTPKWIEDPKKRKIGE